MDEIADIKRRSGIDEAGAGPSRIVQHIKAGRPFFTIAAEREYRDDKANKEANRQLKSALSKSPVGYIKQSGEWEGVAESSYIVFPNNNLDDHQLSRFRDLGQALMQKFDQLAIVFGDGEKIVMINNDGSVDDWGLDSVSFSPDKMKSAGGHSTIKGQNYVFAPSDSEDRNSVKLAASAD